MMVEHLSDHAGDLLRDSKRRRRNVKLEQAVRQTDYHWALDDLRAARRAAPLWRRMLGLRTENELKAARRVEQAQLRIGNLGDRENLLDAEIGRRAAGELAERRLELGLLGTLSDEWTLFQGYRNRRGEVDGLLVGPSGLWAVEVKGHNALLHVDGDRWFYQVHDASGRLRETRWATDATGRSWARQVNDVADDLAKWLERKRMPATIRRSVLLLGSTGRVGQVRRPDVDLVADDTEPLLDAVERLALPLSGDERATIAELIRQDHRFHNERRAAS